MPKITISYRREDSGVIVGRIFDRLVAHYGSDTVFRDIDNIPPGIDFRKYINEALGSTDILLAIIGPDWAGKYPDGRTRIGEQTDLVRIEVEAALQKDIPVVPVLVAKATMPQPNELPEALQDFAYRNAIKVDAFEDFDDHLRRLIRSLDRLLQSTGARPPRVEIQKGAEQEPDKAVGAVMALMDGPQGVDSKVDQAPSEQSKTAAKNVPWWVIAGGVITLGVIAFVARPPVTPQPAPAVTSQPPLTDMSRPAPANASKIAPAVTSQPPLTDMSQPAPANASKIAPPNAPEPGPANASKIAPPNAPEPGPADTSQDATAMYNLGLRYANGEGVPRDYGKARELYEKAAAKDNTDAMTNLGTLYQFGDGVAQDYGKARELYGKAAAKDNAYAIYNLGTLYENGQGVPRDYGKARELYEKAAAKGSEDAKERLKTLPTR